MTVKQLEKRIAYLEMVAGLNDDLILTIRDVINAVSEVYDMSFLDIKTKSRKKEFVEPRRMICFLSNYYNIAGCVQIAKILEVDHTTVIHLRDSVRDFLQSKDAYVTTQFLRCKQILEK